jgi:hypothetical protein
MPLVRIDLREGKSPDYRANEGRSLDVKKRLYRTIADQYAT